MKINVGCGQTPTPTWRNFDNSISLRLSRFPKLVKLAVKLGVLNKSQLDFISFVIQSKIQWADATRHIPVPDSSVEVLYTSHMLEHLDRVEVDGFMIEALRIIRPGGIIRIVVPDLRKLVNIYLDSRDADAFVKATHLCIQKPRGCIEYFKFLFAGPRHHHWMYDGDSLCSVLADYGFIEPDIVNAGHTRIKNPEPLDLYERESDSVYVEAIRP
jgi:hypothetical protein